jgi:hypothetical protein
VQNEANRHIDLPTRGCRNEAEVYWNNAANRRRQVVKNNYKGHKEPDGPLRSAASWQRNAAEAGLFILEMVGFTVTMGA